MFRNQNFELETGFAFDLESATELHTMAQCSEWFGTSRIRDTIITLLRVESGCRNDITTMTWIELRAEWPNKPDAVNPAMALRFAIEDLWRRVTDLERSAKEMKRD
jgi:hypothetical protein